MGFRAVRYCLHREDVYKPQLRALLRASAFGNIKIMIPLVTCIDEVREVKAMIENIMQGKVKKYYSEVCLLDQEYIKDDKKTVKDILGGVEIEKFVRYSL